MKVRQNSQPECILSDTSRGLTQPKSRNSSTGSSGAGCGSRDTYRLVVLGAGGVGKTSLVSRFILGEFVGVYQPTIEDSYRHVVQLPDGIFQSIEIVDTAGYHQFPAMQQLSIQSGNAFFVVFDVCSRQSFDHARHLMEIITFAKGATGGAPIILVGNKKDLEDGREISSDEAHDLTTEFDCGYIETSAKDNNNIEHVFSEILARSFASCTKDLDLSRRSPKTKALLSKYRRGPKVQRLDSTGSDGEASPACSIL
ncbi:hypothetical protein CAPTEDRAFT_186003 [Capitella teleta]|uniref:Small monomeric GTPase n=1 Tax=Capitella teleta TaxID=283909 RepID=R7VAG5_CAPTE|nr:hypothetical protein CAPTEDRAFT_186003 [Capitella teleta]|eukprot:ELU13331.1 hypothetical protein CAPTEDRAFT_186003 [Capitella teleta]